MDKLTARQKQILGGALLLALGIASGVVIAPDDPQRDDKLAELAATAGAIAAGKAIDVAEYHRAMKAARAGRADRVDLLTAEVAPGASVTAEVNVPMGARPDSVDFVGPAEGRFAVVSMQHIDKPGRPLPDAGTLPDRTTILVTARNTSSDVVRLVALLHLTPAGP